MTASKQAATEIHEVKIGRIREGDDLSIHLSINGSTCHSLRPVNVEMRTASEAAKRCKSCFRGFRWEAAREWVRALLNKIRMAGRNRYDARTDRALTVQSEMLATQAERDHVAELVARYHAPQSVAPRTLAEMRAVNLRTLPQPAEPARYVNLAA